MVHVFAVSIVNNILVDGSAIWEPGKLRDE